MSRPRDVICIGLPADRTTDDGLPHHSVGDMYIRALTHFADVMPVVVPSGLDRALVNGYLDRLDGVLLTGAASNVDPRRYGVVATPVHEPLDPARDQLVFSLIDQALARHMPLLGICRGCQEINVALGGTLDAEVSQRPGNFDHRAPASDDLEVCFASRHEVALTAGGVLRGIVERDTLRVNSLHRQAVDRLALGVQIEARARDGTVEAISVPQARGFTLAVQWHPEWDVTGDAASLTLFTRFIDECRRFRRLRVQAIDVHA